MGNKPSTNMTLVKAEDNDGKYKEKKVITAKGVMLIESENVPSFKIVVIGDGGVGKTSIIRRFIRNGFGNEYVPTKKVTIESVVRNVNYPTKAVGAVTIWDIPSSEDIDLRSSYYRNVDAAIVVVNLSDIDSIELACAWKQDFLNKATRSKMVTETLPSGEQIPKLEQLPCDPATIPVLLVGNKYDLIENELVKERLQKTLQQNVLENESDEITMEKGHKDVIKMFGKGERESTVYLQEKFPQVKILKTGDVVPHCVELLKEVEEQFGFIGSVMVSAKDPDGCAEMAVQAIIRHLLISHLPKKEQEKKDEKPEEKDGEEEEEEELLQSVGIESLDELFSKCGKYMKQSRDYIKYYKLAMKNFKEACLESELLILLKPSLEDCIIAINKNLTNTGALQLATESKEHFIELLFINKHDIDIPIGCEHVVQLFNTELWMMSNAIIRDCPVILKSFDKLDIKIEVKCDNLHTLLQDEGDNEVSKIRTICEKNRAVLSLVVKEVKDCLETVQNSVGKVKAAIMW